MSKMKTRPIVSLGLPVYNGENFLAETIDSLLSQTFQDFELILSDNASSDATERICLAYQRVDSRIRYIRHPKNLGAAANYNFVFHQSRGRYFKWCAHDDLISSDFLERCVKYLDENPECVGAFPKYVKMIDGESQVISEQSADLEIYDDKGAARFANIAPKSRLIPIMSFFALYRRDVLCHTGLHGSFQSSDRVLIAEVLLYGRIEFLETSYFAFRKHPNQYSARMAEGQNFCVSWLDTSADGKIVFKHLRYTGEFIKVVLRAKLSFSDRLIALRGIAKLVKAQRQALIKELMFPFYRNGKLTRVGERARLIRKKILNRNFSRSSTSNDR